MRKQSRVTKKLKRSVRKPPRKEIRNRGKDEQDVSEIIDELQTIRRDLIRAEERFATLIASTHPIWRESARNLVHYLALRRFDIRRLQTKLAAMGLSSLGRSEGHVMATIESVLNVLLNLSTHGSINLEKSKSPGYGEGTRLLEKHTEALLGERPANRFVRIMVTMPSEAADDYSLVRDLIASGTDHARINCARDNEITWRRMLGNVRRASKELGMKCRVEFDLAGRKLRTYIEPGPRVIKWSPQRNELGRIIKPPRIWLTPREKPEMPTETADACLSVEAKWLESLKVGSKIKFTDLRGKKRSLTVVRADRGSWWAESDSTAYVGPETLLKTKRESERESTTSRVGEISPTEASILLRIGDSLFLTCSNARDSTESVIKVGGLSHEILASVRPG
jgi:pyruvate kinase